MKIKQRFEFVEGDFDTDTEKLVCVQRRKYGEVLLCFEEGMNYPFSRIKLHAEDRAVEADAVFDDAVNLCEEIARRWNDEASLKAEIKALKDELKRSNQCLNLE